MIQPLVLASTSSIRAKMMRDAGLVFETAPARIDEDSVRAALVAEDATPRDIADTLAEMKALKISAKLPDALVLGCDQVLDLNGTCFGKPASADDASAQLKLLRGQTHRLLSAVVLCQHGKPLWRHVGVARLTMRDFSDTYLSDYVDRNWDSIRYSVGGYKLEEEGVRLFSLVQGDYFTVLGLPLLNVLNHLTTIGAIEG